MKNKSLVLFIIIGFIVTTLIWGFVGGCGTSHISWKSRPGPVTEEGPSAEGVILEGTSIPGQGQTYIVEPGDTLWGISKKFKVSVSSIREVNKLETDAISAGQKLIIPGVVGPQELQLPKSAEPKPGLIVYKVRKDDSLWRIAQVHGTTIEHIAEINGLPKNARLTPGQEIMVPSNE